MRAVITAATGMAAQELNVQVISNNIANLRTTGYRIDDNCGHAVLQGEHGSMQARGDHHIHSGDGRLDLGRTGEPRLVDI